MTLMTFEQTETDDASQEKPIEQKPRWDPKAYWTDERRAMHSIRMKERFADPVLKAHLAEVNKGRILSEEVKAVIAEKTKAYWSKPENREAQRQRMLEKSVGKRIYMNPSPSELIAGPLTTELKPQRSRTKKVANKAA